MENWDRLEHYQFFRRSNYGHYHIGTDLDITHFKAMSKQLGLPFSFCMTHAVTAAMSEVEAFCYRIRGGRVVLHEQIHPYFAYLAPDKKYFKMVLAEMTPSMKSLLYLQGKKRWLNRNILFGRIVWTAPTSSSSPRFRMCSLLTCPTP